MYQFRQIILLFIGLTVCACAPKLQGVTGDIDGPITPITRPTLFTFSPFKSTVLHLESHTVVGSKTISYMITDIHLNATKIDDEYLWEMATYEVKTQQKNYKSKIPIFEIRVLTDAFGNISNMEISSPAFVQQGIPFYPGSPRYEAAKSGAINNITVLCKDAIKSGDILFYLNPCSFGNIRFDDENLKIGPKLLGYSYINGIRVVVAQLAESGVGAYNVNDKTKLVLDFKGSYYFDANTMLQVGGESIVDVRSYTTGEHARVINTISQ